MDFQALLENFRVVFACNSNQIEGNKLDYYSTREVYETGFITNYTGSLRDLFEVRNQKNAFEVMLKFYDDRVRINIEMIKELHKEPMSFS